MKDYINDFMLYLEAETKVLEGTRISYKRDLAKYSRYVQESLDGIDLIAVTHNQIVAYVAYMVSNHAANTTISRSVVSLKAFYGYLAYKEVIPENIVSGVMSPKIEKVPPRTLTKEEVEHLLEAPSKTKPKQIRDRAMLALLYATGMKVTELIELKVSDVNLKKGCVRIKGIQESNVRVIPIGSVAKKAIVYYLKNARPAMEKRGESDILFLNCSGKVMSRQGFWKLMKTYAQRAGIEAEITPHILRNTCAAHMIENGADIKSVQEVLGHASLNSTQVYVMH